MERPVAVVEVEAVAMEAEVTVRVAVSPALARETARKPRATVRDVIDADSPTTKARHAQPAGDPASPVAVGGTSLRCAAGAALNRMR